MTAPFSRSAVAYDALLRQKDYRRASVALMKAIGVHAPRARTLLDVGCGTGRHLEWLRGAYEVEGLDQSRQMLDIARLRCPGVRFHQGSLLDFSLGRRFDVVTCLFGSIAYVRTAAELSRTVTRLARHVEPGGLVVLEPWVEPDRYIVGRVVLDHAVEPGLTVARVYRSARHRNVAILDSHYVVAAGHGVEHFVERQALGLFSDRQYRAAFSRVGFDVVATTPDLFGYGLYVCQAADRARRTGSRRR